MKKIIRWKTLPLLLLLFSKSSHEVGIKFVHILRFIDIYNLFQVFFKHPEPEYKFAYIWVLIIKSMFLSVNIGISSGSSPFSKEKHKPECLFLRIKRFMFIFSPLFEELQLSFR